MQVQPRQTPRTSGSYVGALILIAIGVVALISNVSGTDIASRLLLLVIGLGFLTTYALTRKYGFLVPGGILSGLGAGVLVESYAGPGSNGMYAALGLALGFLLIYAVDLAVARGAARWWPLIPGGVMLLVVGTAATEQQGLIKQVGPWAPVILVAIGIWLLVTRGRTAKN
jgi:hypothetical protein